MTARTPHLRIAPTAPGDTAAAPAALTDRAAGERILQRDGLAGLRGALQDADSRADDGGWRHFWRGYLLQFEDLGLARAHWLQAEQRFADARDAEGLDCAASGLVQATLLDYQSYAGFDARAARVARMDTDDAPMSALAAFHLAARMLLMAERRESLERATDDLERAFGALAADVDREIALRLATAALPTLGLALDRVRGEDFFQAGAAVAASSRVGAYGRALWHLLMVESCAYDPAWSLRLRDELADVDRLASAHGFRAFQARAHIIRAAMALGAGDVAGGRASLDAAHPLLDPAHPPDYWAFHYYSSRHALQVGATDEAWDHAKVSLRKLEDAGVSPARTTPVLMQQAFVLAALGRLDEAAEAFARAGALSRGAQATPCLAHVHLTRGLAHWRSGAHDEARAELVAGFVQARSIDLTHFFRALPAVAAEACGAALALDADPAFARRVVATRSLPCPDLGIEGWPWPIKVRALDGFVIERDGAPVRFSRKAPRRLLDLVRLITALGGRHVDAARAAGTLWPDAEGHEARDALKTMLHRARALLGADLLAVREGQVGFDEARTWVDTWAFEHVCGRIEALLGGGAASTRLDDGELDNRRAQLLALYRGHLFGEAELPAWALPLRDRLRARFVRSVDMLGQRLEQTGRPDAAIALYRAALEHDNLAEELYQRLIACHLARGESAQALHAYRRCRELLSIVLGVRPSARTEALVARIAPR